MSIKLFLIFLLIFCLIVEDLACRCCVKKKPTKPPKTKKTKKTKPTPRHYLQHWSVPDHLDESYRKWRLWYRDQELVHWENNSPWQKFSIPEGWPTPKNYAGYGGRPPPPWAVVTEDYGKPDHCYGEPEFGYCYFNVTRWGFNSFKNQCDEFRWSGCGGNDNNFVTKFICEELCLSLPYTQGRNYKGYKDYEYRDNN